MPTLSPQLIVQTAIELADREGFEAVTLRRIATELDVHVTSLYNHVATREAVTEGIVTTLIEEAGLPVTPTDWESWVRGFVESIGEVAERHPGAFAALQLRPVQGEVANASSEAGLAAFTAAGLDIGDAYSALKATTFLAIAIGIEKSLASRGTVLETALDDLPPEGFPQLHALQDAVHDEQAAWSFGVETLVAGLNAQLRRLNA